MSEQDNHTAIYEECKNLNTLLNDGKPHGLEECASMMPSMLELIMKHAEKKETMNNRYELDNLIQFKQVLDSTHMYPEAVTARVYDFALALCRSNEERQLPKGVDISATQQVQIMQHAADLLYTVICGCVPKV